MPTLPTEPSGHRVCIQRPSAGVDAAQADRNDISKETSDLGHHDCTLRHRTRCSVGRGTVESHSATSSAHMAWSRCLPA